MNTYNQSIVARKILCGAVLLAVFIAAFGTGSLSPAHAQMPVSNNPSQTSAPHLSSYAAGLYGRSEYYSINSIQKTSSMSIQKVAKVAPKNITGDEFGDLPLNAHNAMTDAVQSRPTGILDGGTYFVVGHYESDEVWGIGHLGAAVGTEPPDWGTSVWFIVQTKNTIQVALQGTSLFTEFMIDLPMSFKDQIDMQSKNELSAQATTFLFPWDKSQQWRYSYGWHGNTVLALDFAPTNVTPNNMWILASASGTVTLVCSDPYQAAINLSTPDGVMNYRHIDYNSFIAQNVKDKAVTQGQKLSLLYNGTQGEGYYDTSQNYPWPSCVQGSSSSCTYIKYNTYCGAGTGAHVHWTLPSKPFTVDDWQVDVNGLWTKSGQTSKNVGALFTSTNSPSMISISGNTGIGGATVSYTYNTPQTVTTDGSGNYSFSVESGWSGTLTPYKIQYAFTPANRAYSNIQSSQIAQDYTALACPTCADADTAGVFRPSNGLLYLKNANTSGFADVSINYGAAGDYPVAGDWDGNHTATIGIYRNGSFYLRNSNTLGFADLTFAFGTPGDQPVAGDWNGDGTDTIGVYRPSTGQFLLRNSNTSGEPDMSFYLGNVGDVGIAGDWDGDGMDSTGVFRPSNGVLFMKNANTTGFADIAINYGTAGDQPVTGDWDNNGTDTIGVYRNAQFYLRNSNTLGFADLVFALGIPADMPIAGNWDGMP